MTIWDWLLVVILNGSIIVFGLYLSRGVHSSADWFLAGRSLPWWLVGLSMYATAIDSSDLVADSGGTYELGFSFFVTNWIGVVGGWVLAGFLILPTIYRAGMYTNAEYLEARFGASSRLLCALIQVQYRSLVLAIISKTLFLTLAIVCGMGDNAWWAVAGIAILATMYTALGGLKSVAVTDALQFIVMTVAGLIIWVLVWNQVGGWDGIERRLDQHEASLSKQLLHVGVDQVERISTETMTLDQVDRKLLTGGDYDRESSEITRLTPAWVVIVAFIIIGAAYSIVNHTQTMRLFASKSEWDLKMSVWVAGGAMLAMTFFNLSMGVMGRALFPDPSVLPGGAKDAIYPHLVSQFAIVGLKGIVVAGVLAASFSTFDSIGSTLSALLTRDVYARFMVKDRDDQHYLRVGQWLTPLIIGGSFLYVPILDSGMLLTYINITSAFVIPLLTLFVMGVLTRVNRRAGLIGMLVGVAYGVLRLSSSWFADQWGVAVLPRFMANSFAAYFISMLITAGTMVGVSLFYGWEPRGELQHEEESGWLRSSQLQVRNLETPAAAERSFALPAILALIAIGIGVVLSFVVFW